jgi:hypothetical protein
MAKGQKKSNKEVRKPKKTTAKAAPPVPMRGVLATPKGK